MPKATQKTKGRLSKTLAEERGSRPQKIAKAAHKAGDESSDEGDIPPEVRVNLPSLKEIHAELKDPKDVNLPVDILLLTAKDCELSEKSKKRRLRDRRLAHRINRFTRPFPLEAGFFACLCNTVDMSPGHAQLRLYCYPARLEPKVIENACSAHDIDRYGNGDSLLTLFHGDELRAKLWRGSEVKKTLKLRFRYDRKFEVDAIVRVLKEVTPHVKFLQHLREQSPRELCKLTIATQCQRKARDPHHGLRFKAGEPCKDELEALSRKLGNKWENLARRLGFDSDGEIDAFKEEKGLANKAFSMLKEWNQKEGSKGTYVVLGKALCHKFVGCTKLAEEFCCDKIEGNGSL